MKISIAISVLILAVGFAIRWNDQRTLTVVREAHAKLVAEAGRLGISTDPAALAAVPRPTKRGEREDKQAEARLAAVEFIAFAKEMEALQNKGDQPDEAMQKRTMEFMDRMMSLDASQLKFLIAELRETTELKDETRQGLIAFSIMTLASDQPQAALALFTESSDLLDKGMMGGHVVSSALSRWANEDPMAALEWVRKNGEKFPDLVTDGAKRGLISGAAINDPQLAFKLIGELGIESSTQAVNEILSTAKTPEDRTKVFAAFREHLATLPDESACQAAFDSAAWPLARGVASEGFEAATQWVDQAGLSPAELASFSKGLPHSVKSSETGQWIEWIGGKLDEKERDQSVRNMVSNWTRKDFQATGTWLNNTPAGPVKEAAIRSYAETVSSYEPEAAAQWAVTLPAGKERDATLKQIYQNWPKKDDAGKQAAEAFKQQHGIR